MIMSRQPETADGCHEGRPHGPAQPAGWSAPEPDPHFADGRWLLAVGIRSNTDIATYLIDLTNPDVEAVCVTAEHGNGYFVPGPWTPDSAAFYLCTDMWGEFTSIGRYTLNDASLARITADNWDVEHIEAAGDILV